MIIPFSFHLLGENVDYFSCLYYTSFLWRNRGLYLSIPSAMIELPDYSGKKPEMAFRDEKWDNEEVIRGRI